MGLPGANLSEIALVAMRRIVAAVLAVLVLSGVSFAAAGSTSAPCTRRLLVMSALPSEIYKLINAAQLDPSQTVVIDGRSFFFGSLEGNNVIMALSGIGLVNAHRTTETAIQHFRCGSHTAIKGIVFSGTSGGLTHIGDVHVARRFTLDGKTWLNTDPAMLQVVRKVVGAVTLAQQAPLGDKACVGLDPATVRLWSVTYQPKAYVGGNGESSDTFGGRAWFCVPAGSDLFGCDACHAPSHAAPDPIRFAMSVAPFVDPNFFFANTGGQALAPGKYDVQDEETAAVGQVATQNHIPYVAFRAISDGAPGDPYSLPDSPFPIQYEVYKQLAADNAATVALAFLKAWAKR
jgi:nucleoside phosphorylase